jgi:hypothetical protein
MFVLVEIGLNGITIYLRNRLTKALFFPHSPIFPKSKPPQDPSKSIPDNSLGKELESIINHHNNRFSEFI